MPRDNPARHFIFTFLIALALYAVTYSWIEHRRHHKGPWEVSFTTSTNTPLLIINQPALGLTNVTLLFGRESLGSTNAVASANNESNQPTHLDFRTPKQTPFDVPFGKCVFEDLTFLPGTVTFQMLGHEIELYRASS